MDYILELKGLTKQYGEKTVVDHVDLKVKKGHIYGLIGPNGAGKTTIMKMIAGTAMPDGGVIKLFGSETDIEKKRERTSFMIESPYIDGSMTARQNMEYIRYLRGVADKKKIDEKLEFVGLGKVGKKQAKHFSLGMKQRLGIAMALLPDPEIMILDEPVNGLDPEGIVEVRKLLIELAEKRGITILISSHLLAELSELCTDYTIIDQGRIVESLSKEELAQNCRNYIAIATTDNEKLTTVLEQQLDIQEYKVMEKNEIHYYDRIDEIEEVSKAVTDAGLIITKLNSEGEKLEEYYLSKVSKGQEEVPRKTGLLDFVGRKGGR